MANQFSFERLLLEGAYKIQAFAADDERGRFVKDYATELFAEKGLKHDLKEVFYTYSHPGVVRAMHFQRIKQQPKLVRCLKGKVYDVIIDLRKNSPTFKKWLGLYLTEDNLTELYVPAGFGHGYLVYEESIVSYKCAEKFYGEYDDGIRWDDAEMDIQWPLAEVAANVILSDKDKNLPSFEEFLRRTGGGF